MGLDPGFVLTRNYGFAGTVFRLPRRDYYRYLLGFCILPLGSWSLSTSWCCMLSRQKPLSYLLKFCWCGWKSKCQTLPLYTSSQAVECSLYVTVLWHFYIASPVLYSLERFNTGTCTYDLWGPWYALGYTGVLGSIDIILKFAQTHSCFMSHTHLFSRGNTTYQWGWAGIRRFRGTWSSPICPFKYCCFPTTFIVGTISLYKLRPETLSIHISRKPKCLNNR